MLLNIDQGSFVGQVWNKQWYFSSVSKQSSSFSPPERTVSNEWFIRLIIRWVISNSNYIVGENDPTYMMPTRKEIPPERNFSIFHAFKRGHCLIFCFSTYTITRAVGRTWGGEGVRGCIHMPCMNIYSYFTNWWAMPLMLCISRSCLHCTVNRTAGGRKCHDHNLYIYVDWRNSKETDDSYCFCTHV